MTSLRLKDNLKAQVAADHAKRFAAIRCSIPFCSRFSMRSEGTGFGMFLCKYHQARLAKHGHPEIPTIKGPDLKTYVETAQRWIKAELATGNVRVQLALSSIGALMQTAGNAPAAMNIKQWSPEDKAEAAFARLREAAITAERIIATHMGVTAYLADDTWSPRSEEYRLVQSAKAIHRLASGTHREWEIAVPLPIDAPPDTPETQKVSVHVYPRSQGQVLRVIGKAIDEACGTIAEEQAQAIIEAKERRFGRHPCHTPGYEPEWRIADRAKHAAALKARQQAAAEAQNQAAIRELLKG